MYSGTLLSRHCGKRLHISSFRNIRDERAKTDQQNTNNLVNLINFNLTIGIFYQYIPVSPYNHNV